MTTAMYSVEGMMCESCATAVVEKVQALSGVTDVVMDLVSGGSSPLIVTSGIKLGAHAVRNAIGHIGFDVPSRTSREVRDREVSPVARLRDGIRDRQPLLSLVGGVSS